MEQLKNKVAESGLITIDLADYIPSGNRKLLDISEWLFEGLLLKEQDYRDHVKKHDWTQYDQSFVALTCTSDAIIPVWAWMLVEVALQPYARKVVFGDLLRLEEELILEQIETADVSVWKDARVVIKGCGDKFVPASAYALITRSLAPLAKSIMYGEPCSTVPVMKRKA